MPDYGSNFWDELEDLGDGFRGTRLLQHHLINRSDEVARFVVAASHVTPEIVEYVDEGEAIAWSIHDSLVTGESLEFRKQLRED